MGIGQRLAPQRSAGVLGLLTAAYGTGQIIGPLLAGIAAEQTASFALPLMAAAGVVAAGGVLLVVGGRRECFAQTQSISEHAMKGTTDAIR
jgi:MFS family permease